MIGPYMCCRFAILLRSYVKPLEWYLQACDEVSRGEGERVTRGEGAAVSSTGEGESKQRVRG